MLMLPRYTQPKLGRRRVKTCRSNPDIKLGALHKTSLGTCLQLYWRCGAQLLWFAPMLLRGIGPSAASPATTAAGWHALNRKSEGLLGAPERVLASREQRLGGSKRGLSLQQWRCSTTFNPAIRQAAQILCKFCSGTSLADFEIHHHHPGRSTEALLRLPQL